MKDKAFDGEKKPFSKPYPEYNPEVLILDAKVKKDFKEYFEIIVGKMNLSTINIDREKLSLLNKLTRKQNEATVVKLVDNILNEWLENYKDEIRDLLNES